MKYFEINYPYYALIKAENTKEATKAYVDSVAGDEVERPAIENLLKEVDRDYALIKFSKSPGEDGKPVSILETMQDFNSEKNDVLLIDGSLI